MSAAPVIARYADANAFLAATQSWLLGAEAENNLLLGIALGCRGKSATDPPAYWASAHGVDGIRGCACRTPPHGLVLSRLPPHGVAALVADVAGAYGSLNSVNGPAAEAEEFAETWVAQRGGSSRVRFRMRLHELRVVSLAGPRAAGTLREAVNEDLPLARSWIAEFVRDVGLPHASLGLAEQLITAGQLFLWVAGGAPRAMVAATRQTRSGCAINTVYTPPQFRGRGHATAAVAALSERLLGAKQDFCCLYTDLANPTSNSIYAKIGYRPIRDDLEIAFDV